MKKMLLIVLAITMLFALNVTAEDKINLSDQKATEVSPEAQAVADLALAAKMAAYGKRAKDPVALMAAAQIMKNTPTQEKKRTKKTEGEAVADKGAKNGQLDTPATLLAAAKQLASDQDNDSLAALIERESKITASRGRVGGPAEHIDTVKARTNDNYEIEFRGNRLARVALKGDGDCDLDLYVYDENGNLIAKDNDDSDACYVEWTPSWTGPFVVKVKNLGSVYAHYLLLTN